MIEPAYHSNTGEVKAGTSRVRGQLVYMSSCIMCKLSVNYHMLFVESWLWGQRRCYHPRFWHIHFTGLPRPFVQRQNTPSVNEGRRKQPKAGSSCPWDQTKGHCFPSMALLGYCSALHNCTALPCSRCCGHPEGMSILTLTPRCPYFTLQMSLLVWTEGALKVPPG